jgi:NADPH:quinone reductase
MTSSGMLAFGVEDFGRPLRPLRLARPAPAPGEVLIRVAAAAVNPADTGMVAGRYRWADPVRFPLVPGYDVAGIDVATGRRVLGFTAHKLTQRGAYAEFVALPADLVVPLPDTLGLPEAATLPLAGLTACQALDAIGPVGTLLINGPRGAIGGFATQLAAARGITVVTDGPVDAALDVIGGDRARTAFDAVRDGGRYVTVVPSFWVPGGPFGPERGVTPEVISVHHDRAQLAKLVKLAAAGRLTTSIGRSMPLAEAAEALRIVARSPGAPPVRGKVVLTLASDG